MEYLLIAVAALAVVIVSTVLSRRTGVAVPLLLLVVGIAASFLPAIPDFVLAPEWILAGVLPPLLYSSAVRFPVTDLRRNLGLISWLSVIMVVASALVIGVSVHALFPQIPVALGIALGAVVSPTDAVAATAIGRRLGLPPRLMSVLEGESLMNDATALVLLRTALAAVMGTFSFWQAIGDFAVAVLVALVIGGLIAGITIMVRARISDPVLTSTISFFVPFLAYFPAEELHGSGVLATVVAGVISGHGSTRRFSAAARSTEAANWATISFVLESAVFLVMGLELPGLVTDARSESSMSTVAAIGAVVFGLLLALRVAGVTAAIWFSSRSNSRERSRRRIEDAESKLGTIEPSDDHQERRAQIIRRWIDRVRADLAFEENQPIGRKSALVLSWAGMRGVVTLAAAQTIPEGTDHRAVVVLVAFFVSVATLVGFGSTLPLVIRRMHFRESSTQDKREEVRALVSEMVDTASEQLGPLEDQQIDGRPIDTAVVDRMSKLFAPLLKGALPQGQEHADTRDQLVELTQRYVAALREALLDERSIGNYRADTYLKVQGLLDQFERRGETTH